MRNLPLLSLFLLAWLLQSCNPVPAELPNILWITSEDNMALLSCYGDDFATTPHLDLLATQGFRYTKAYANAPVCAPARNTIITGVHACSNGNEHMRSRYAKSDLVRPYPEFLREKGYYCTNNSKTDYNYADVKLEEIWDECGEEAHYRTRAEDQPFFAVFNLTRSHESSIHTSIPDSLLQHRPEEVSLPPFHPDVPEMRHDWAQYYDRVTQMDTLVGQVLAELEEAGLAENTLVFYYSDHGGVLGRSKRFLYETGTHVPMIVRIPEKYKKLYPEGKPGASVDRLVSFVDLAPTLLSLIGIPAPGYMQGKAFLGKHQQKAQEHIYMFRDRMDGRYDMCRSIVDGRYRYTLNFNSNRIWGQRLEYLWRAPSMQAWEREFKAGRCNEVQSRFWKHKPVEELYDVEADPWEINNLAGDPAHSARLSKMRTALMEKAASMLDAGFLPEADRIERTGEQAAYDYMRSADLPFDQILEAAQRAAVAHPENLGQLLSWLDHEDSAVRYWAAQGLLLLGEGARPALEEVLAASSDPSWNVRVVCAEIMYTLGEKEKARSLYGEVLASEQVMARTHALNSIDCIGGSADEFLNGCLGVLNNYEVYNREYDVRVAFWLLKKWGIDPVSKGINYSI